MLGSTPTIRRLTGLMVVAGAFAALAPIAQADSGFQGTPDAIDRAVAARQAQLGSDFQGSPDAIDRAVAAKQAQKLSTIDARERGMLERPAHYSVAPDAFERALITHADSVRSQTISMLNSRERALGERPTPSSPSLASGGFDWSDFSLGAGAGIGLMLVLVVLAAGVGVPRRGHERATTA